MAFAVHPFLVWSIPTKDPMDSHLVAATRGPLLRGRATAFACTGLCSLATYSTASFMRTIFVKPSHFLPFIAFLMTFIAAAFVAAAFAAGFAAGFAASFAAGFAAGFAAFVALEIFGNFFAKCARTLS